MSICSRFFWAALLAIATSISIGRAAQPAAADFAEFDRRALAGDRLTVVFFGASLTWGANATDPMLTSYRAEVAHRLEQKYPAAHFTFRDGAIGGTGSQLGLFRLERDALRHQPDLVFLDFSANDGITSANPETLASYEAIVRRIIVDAKAPVVQVIFPFMWDVAKGTTTGMLRRDAHLAISAAYHTPVGDAIDLAQKRVKDGRITLKQVWPADGVHPGDVGYQLFADAAWDAYLGAVAEKRACVAPEKMLHASTYMSSARVRISALGTLPEGWKVGTANLTSAFFDMLMSRWLDDEVIASNAAPGEGSKPPAGTPAGQPAPPAPPRKQPGRLKANFAGNMVMLFGEATPKSGKYKVYIDGKLIPRKSNDGKIVADEFDAGEFGKRVNGNAHHVQILAEGLEAGPHTLEIEPDFDPALSQELRLESICVAGASAAVSAAK